MKIFMNIMLFVILALLFSSIVFTILSYRIEDKMTVKIEDKDCIFTSHKLYPKYRRYEKLGNYLQLLTVICTIIGVIVYVISEGITWSI